MLKKASYSSKFAKDDAGKLARGRVVLGIFQKPTKMVKEEK